MIQRCTNENAPAFKNYGGRGIQVSASWREFSAFYADMGDPPIGLTLDRRDNDLGYCKDNCYWATDKQQSSNKRTNIVVTIDAITLTLKEWCERKNLKYWTVHARIRRGASAEGALR